MEGQWEALKEIGDETNYLSQPASNFTDPCNYIKISYLFGNIS